MSLPRIVIDFSQGIVSLADGELEVKDVEASLNNPSALGSSTHGTYSAVATIDGVQISVVASRSENALHVSLLPPDELDFWEKDERAGEIVGALARTYHTKMRKSGEYWWGRLKLLREWQDGGWGAHFTFYRPRPKRGWVSRTFGWRG